MRSTKKRQKQSNQHTSSINIFHIYRYISISKQAKKKKKNHPGPTWVRTTNPWFTRQISPIDLTRKGQEAFSSISNCNLELKI